MKRAQYTQLDGDGAHQVVEPIEGASIRETLLELLAEAKADRLEVRGIGRVDGVRLRSGGKVGGVDVMSLTGSVAGGEVRLALVGVDAAGALIGGELVDARVVHASLVIEAFVVARSSTPTVASMSTAPSTTPSTTTSTSSSSSTATGWKEVAAASLQAEIDATSSVTIDAPRPGDTIEHASFGVCLVEKLEEDEDFVLVRSPQNRLLRLSLEVLRPELLSESGGKRAFRSRAKAKR